MYYTKISYRLPETKIVRPIPTVPHCRTKTKTKTELFETKTEVKTATFGLETGLVNTSPTCTTKLVN